jgi:hypothetical protein
LKDPDNQKKIKEWVDDFGKFVKNMEDLAKFIEEKVLPALSKLMGFIDTVKNKYDEWHARWNALKSALTTPINFGGVFDSIRESFRGALNWIIGKWNSLSFHLPSVDFLGVHIGGTTISTGYIQPFAQGGVVQPRPGGVIGRIGEAGQVEGVAPVDTLQQYIRTAVTEANAASAAGGDITIPVYIGTELVDTIVVSAAQRQKTALAKAVNAGNKSLGYAG